MATREQAILSSSMQQPPPLAIPRPLRIVVVDDSPDFLEVICGLLRLEDSIEIVGYGTDGTQSIRAVADLHPDLLLMDVQMPYMSGSAATLIISQHFPTVNVVLMSSEDSLQTRIACKSSGAQALVYKPAFRKQFLEVLEKIYSGIGPEPTADQNESSLIQP